MFVYATEFRTVKSRVMRRPVWVLTISSSNWGWPPNVAVAKAAHVTSWPNAAPPDRSPLYARSPAFQRARHGLPDPDWRQPDGRDGIGLVDFAAMTSFVMVATPQPPFVNIFKGMSRNTVIATCVVLFHVLALWAFQNGLLRRAIEVIVPVEMVSGFVEPPTPKVTPMPPAPPSPPVPAKQPAAVPKATPLPAPSQPVAIADTTPSPNAPTGVTTPQPPAPPVAAPAVAEKIVATASPSPPTIVPPSTDADYLNNPKPKYPRKSNLQGEQGTVYVLVQVGVNGNAMKVDIQKSSGFDGLDQAALDAIKHWRFVPGTRNGVPEISWVVVPMPFSLN